MEELQVALFGKLHIATVDDLAIEIEARKAQELLCFLLLFRHQPHSREVIAETLWRDNRNDQSRSYLRRTLWQLQNILEDHAGQLEQPVLLVEQDWLQLNPLAPLLIDVAVFETAHALVRGIPGALLSEDNALLLNNAADLYQGNLLEGWYQNWCIHERERMQYIYLVMLDKLMRYCEAHSQFEAGIEYGMRILRVDRAREHTHRELMRLYYLARDRNAAIHQYERCAQALQEELGVEPTRRTHRLYEKIKGDAYTVIPNLQEARSTAAGAEQSILQDLYCELLQARKDTRRLGSRLDRQIEAVTKLLSR